MDSYKESLPPNLLTTSMTVATISIIITTPTSVNQVPTPPKKVVNPEVVFPTIALEPFPVAVIIEGVLIVPKTTNTRTPIKTSERIPTTNC